MLGKNLWTCCSLSSRQTEAQETVCCQSCDYTLGRRQPSVIFETHWRLLIGRKFLWVTSLAPFWCNNWNSKTFSRSVFIVYGSCFGGFKSGNGWHASMDQPALVQQLGVKIVPFMIKEWNLGHLQLISFLKKLDIGPSQISHVTNMAAFFKKGVAFLHLTLINL